MSKPAYPVSYTGAGEGEALPPFDPPKVRAPLERAGAGFAPLPRVGRSDD